MEIQTWCPDRVGFYWCWLKDQPTPIILHVWRNALHDLMTHQGFRLEHPIYLGARWYGPLEPPADVDSSAAH